MGGGGWERPRRHPVGPPSDRLRHHPHQRGGGGAGAGAGEDRPSHGGATAHRSSSSPEEKGGGRWTGRRCCGHRLHDTTAAATMCRCSTCSSRQGRLSSQTGCRPSVSRGESYTRGRPGHPRSSVLAMLAPNAGAQLGRRHQGNSCSTSFRGGDAHVSGAWKTHTPSATASGPDRAQPVPSSPPPGPPTTAGPWEAAFPPPSWPGRHCRDGREGAAAAPRGAAPPAAGSSGGLADGCTAAAAPTRPPPPAPNAMRQRLAPPLPPRLHTATTAAGATATAVVRRPERPAPAHPPARGKRPASHGRPRTAAPLSRPPPPLWPPPPRRRRAVRAAAPAGAPPRPTL